VVYLALFWVFGLRFWIVDAVIIAQALASATLCLAIARRVIGDSWYAYLPPAMFVFWGFRWFGIDGNHRILSPIFICLAVYVLLAERSYKRIAVAGILCGIASFFTQQRGVLAVGGIVLFLLIELAARRATASETAKKVITLGASFCVTLTALIAPFVIAAGPKKFFDYTFLFTRNYVQDANANYSAYLLSAKAIFSQGSLISAVMLFYYALIPLVYVVALVYLWFSRKDQNEAKGRESILLVCMVGLALAAGTVAPNAARFYQISVPALIVFGWLLFKFRPKGGVAMPATIAALMVFGLALAVRVQTSWETRILDAPTGTIAFLSPVALEKYAWLRDHAKADDAVFEVYNCAVNFPLLLRNPTEATQLFNTGYSPTWQVAGAIDSLESKKARFVIWDGNWDAEMASLGEGERLKPLYRYLNENYELRKALTPYANRSPQIWERKN
jgi:hypothetical protein